MTGTITLKDGEIPLEEYAKRRELTDWFITVLRNKQGLTRQYIQDREPERNFSYAIDGKKADAWLLRELPGLCVFGAVREENFKRIARHLLLEDTENVLHEGIATGVRWMAQQIGYNSEDIKKLITAAIQDIKK